MGQMVVKPGLRSTIQREITHVGDMLYTASAMTVQRVKIVKNAGTAGKDASRVARDKVAQDLQDVGRLADSAVTSMKNSIPGPNMVAAGNVGRMNIPSQNTYFFENKAKEIFSKAEGVSDSGSRGTGNDVTKDEYKSLRKKTPSNDIRKMVNPNGPKSRPSVRV